nr:hypothetical protein [Alphaproteobacteria bacterium]
MRSLRSVRTVAVCALTGLFLLPTLGAAAEEGIPNTPIICAATEVAQCSETGTCAQGSAVRFNLP